MTVLEKIKTLVLKSKTKEKKEGAQSRRVQIKEGLHKKGGLNRTDIDWPKPPAPKPHPKVK